MVLIRFTDAESKRRAVETLAGNYSFKTWSTGQMLASEDALAELAREVSPRFHREQMSTWVTATTSGFAGKSCGPMSVRYPDAETEFVNYGSSIRALRRD